MQWIRKWDGSNSKPVLAWIVTWKRYWLPCPWHTLYIYLDPANMLGLNILVSFIVARGYLLLVFNALLSTLHWAMHTTLKCWKTEVVPLALTCVSRRFLCMVLKNLQNTKMYFNELILWNLSFWMCTISYFHAHSI